MIKSGFSPMHEAKGNSSEDLTFPVELKVTTKEGMRGKFYHTILDIDKTLAALRKDGWKTVKGQSSSGTGSVFVEKDGKYLQVCINLVGGGYKGTNLNPEALFFKSDWAKLRGEGEPKPTKKRSGWLKQKYGDE